MYLPTYGYSGSAGVYGAVSLHLLPEIRAVVGDDRVAVLGDLDVELEGADAQLEAVREGRDRAFHSEPEAAAMGLDVEVAAGGHGRCGRQQPGDEGKRKQRAGKAAHEGFPSGGVWAEYP